MGFAYSRYADDLCFSSDRRKLPSLIPLFREIVVQEGYKPNERKTKIMWSNRRQTVTGIVVNEKLNLSREYRKLLRAAAHLLSKDPDAELKLPSRRRVTSATLSALNGHLAFLGMVNQDAKRSVEKRNCAL